MPLVTHLRLPARIESLPRFLTTIEDAATRLGFQQSRIMEMDLVVEEALVNIINYAYRGADGSVEIECRWAEPQGLVIEISDRGPAFNPLNRAEPDVNAAMGDRPIGGLGILIMKKLSDSVTYERRDDTNVLTLTFGPPAR